MYRLSSCSESTLRHRACSRAVKVIADLPVAPVAPMSPFSPVAPVMCRKAHIQQQVLIRTMTQTLDKLGEADIRGDPQTSHTL